MTYNCESQGYYYKFLELQENLRRSEEDRLNLEIKLNDIVQRNKEEKQHHYQRLKSQYKDFVESDKYRVFRNEQILQTLEKIEKKISLLSAKSQKFKSLRKYYQTYLNRTNSVEQENANWKNVLNSPGKKMCPENTQHFSLRDQEEKRKTDDNTCNCVSNYLKRNVLNVATEQKPVEILNSDDPRNLNSHNEVLLPLQTFSRTTMKNSPMETQMGSDEYHHDHKKVMDPQNIYRYRLDYPLEGYHPEECLNFTTTENLSKNELEIHQTYPSKTNSLNKCENILSINSPDEQLNIISPDTSIRKEDVLENNIRSVIPENCGGQTEANQSQSNIPDVNHNSLLKKSESFQKPEQYESKNSIIGRNTYNILPPTDDQNNREIINVLASNIVVPNDIRNGEEIIETDVQSQKHEHASESFTNIKFDSNVVLQNVLEDDTKSKPIEIEYLKHENDHHADLSELNSQQQIPKNLEESLESKNSLLLEQKKIKESDVRVSSVEPYPIDDFNVRKESYQTKTSPIHHMTHDEGIPKEPCDPKILLEENENGAFNPNTKILFSDTNEFQKQIDETHTEDSQIEEVYNQELPSASQEQLLEVPVENQKDQLNGEYEFQQNKDLGEDENLTETNGRFEESEQFQEYERNENYFPNDDYPQYVHNEDPINQDTNIQPISFQYDEEHSNVQPLDNNEQLYNTQYDNKDLSYMPYDVSGQGYDQQYYGDDRNYVNYENCDQQYEQPPYQQYEQSNYETQQQSIYDGHAQEQFDGKETNDAYYSEVQYNQEDVYPDDDTGKAEPNSQQEDNKVDAMTKLVDILETDTENISDTDIKISNESDFDFSSNQ